MTSVSVVIPCYNAAPFLRETLASALAQTGVDVQVIVVDDGSTDNSAEIVANDWPQVELIRTVNQGAGAARNCGLTRARGERIQFLDADDLLFPGKLARQSDALERSGADVVYGDWQYLLRHKDGEYELGQLMMPQMTRPAELALLTDFWVAPHAYLYRREIVELVGAFRTDLPIIQDARFTLDCALHGARFEYLPGLVGAYRLHPNQISRNRIGFVRDCFVNIEQIQEWWRTHGGISPERHAALVQAYGDVARMSYSVNPKTFADAYHALLELEPHYVPTYPRHLALASRLVGYPRAEAMASMYRQLKQSLRASIGYAVSEPVHPNAPR